MPGLPIGLNVRRLAILVAVVASTAIAAPSKKPKTPYSLVTGDLVAQQLAPGSPCGAGEDICLDVFLDTTLRNVQVLAGNPVGGRIVARHRAHVPYRRNVQFRLAIIVGPEVAGRRQGELLGAVEDDPICVDSSWFLPEKDGMVVPRRRAFERDGDICFKDRTDY